MPGTERISRRAFTAICQVALIPMAWLAVDAKSLAQSHPGQSGQSGDIAGRDGSRIGSQVQPHARRWVTPQSDQATARGLEWLAKRQNNDGSYGLGAAQGNVAICGLAGMAFLSAGSTPGRDVYGESINRSIDYILAQARPSGLINGPDTAMRGPMFKHGFATTFLAECHGMTRRPDLAEKIAGAVALIAGTQNEEGGWRYQPRPDDGADITVTACVMMALRAARNAGIHVPRETIDRATAYIRRAQNPDGGFMYMVGGGDIAEDPRVSAFPRSAAALTVLYALGQHDTPEIQRGLQYLMGFVPPEGNRRYSAYYYYGHYYAAQAMWQAGGAWWDRWFPAVRDDLVARQSADGSWPSANESDECATAMACITLQTPNDCLPLQQR